MVKYAILLEKIKNKIRIIYNKRLFEEKTGQKISSVKFMGKVEIRNPNVKIGENVHFRGDVILDGDGPIVIGNNVRINHGTIIYASKGGGVYIGDKTGIAAYVYIIDMDHGTHAGDDYHAQPNIVKKVTIGENVWIAQNCTILKGSKIGDNAVCAAKCVITGREIPSNAIAAGVPAKVIKYKA